MSNTIPDPQTDNQDKVEERPAWLAENFKSPEDLAQAYTEAQRKITEQGQLLSNVEQNYQELAGQFESFQAQPKVDPQTAAQQWEEWFVEQPGGAVAYLMEQNNKQLMDQFEKKLQSVQAPQQDSQRGLEAEWVATTLASKYEDFQKYQDSTAKLIQQNPHWVPESLPIQQKLNAVENAYKLAKYEDLQSTGAQAQTLAQQLEAEKVSAQTASGSGGNPLPVPLAKAEWDKIRGANVRDSGF